MKSDIAEEPRAHRPYTLSFYAVLLIVAPFWLVPPLGWIFVIYTLRAGRLYTASWSYLALFTLALCEVRPHDRVRKGHCSCHRRCSSASITIIFPVA